jgi:sulfopyruvate decarboxylase beta subunit
VSPEEEVLKILKEGGVDMVAGLPCDRAKQLFALVPRQFRYVPLSREEEGVGICAGAYLAGGKPTMLIQSSGMGNLINALCSLMKLYELPLPILVSWRGIYRENIIGQEPMGKYLPEMLKALDINYTEVNEREDVSLVRDAVKDSYENDAIHVVLLSPKIWSESSIDINAAKFSRQEQPTKIKKPSRPSVRRFELIQVAAPYLKGKVVISNLGIPSKELYHVLDQESNFYMLGSMGMASPIGLGVSLNTEKDVVVIDGDGSLLMNPGTLATISHLAPKNLTILAIDNGVHGSTGNQPTATATCVDLGEVAGALGFTQVYRVAEESELKDAFEGLGDGPSFIHAMALPGNAKVSNIPLTPLQIKKQVMEFLK